MNRKLAVGILIALLIPFSFTILPNKVSVVSIPHSFATGPSFSGFIHCLFNAGNASGGKCKTTTGQSVTSGDLLVVTVSEYLGAGGCVTPALNDSQGNSFTNITSGSQSSGILLCAYNYYATAISTSSDKLTCTMTGIVAGLGDAECTLSDYTFPGGFVLSTFKSQHQASVISYSVPSLSYSGGTVLAGFVVTNAGQSADFASGFTGVYNSSGITTLQYLLPSGSSSTTMTGNLGAGPGQYFAILAYFTPPPTVTETVVCKLLSTGGTTKNFSYSGGSASPTHGLCSKAGSSTSITINASSMLKITAPIPTSLNRYLSNASFNNINITIGSSSQSNTIYFYQQLNNTWRANPQNPPTWDNAYSFSPRGTFLGIGTTPICTFTVSNGGGVKGCFGFADNDSAVSLPSSFADIVIGTWTGTPPISFTDITGGNTHTVNYILSNITSNVVTVSWINGPMNTTVTINLVKINTGTSIGLANPILASYFLNGNSTVNLVTGSNTFQVQKNSIVTVAGCSLFSNATIRWCLINAIPFSFNASTGVSETLDYWIQNNDSYRWIPPVACANCGLQRPFVFYNSFSILLNTQLASNVGGTTSPTPFVSVWIDNLTSWSTTNPFNYNLSPYTPNATGSIIIDDPLFLTISYTGSTGCPVTNDPFTAFVCGDYVLGLFLSYGNTLTVGWFLAFVLMAFDAYIWLKSNNPGLTLTFLFIEFALFAGVGLGVGGAATSFLSSSVWQVALVFLTIFLAGSVYRLFVGRRDGG